MLSHMLIANTIKEHFAKQRKDEYAEILRADDDANRLLSDLEDKIVSRQVEFSDKGKLQVWMSFEGYSRPAREKFLELLTSQGFSCYTKDMIPYDFILLTF